MLAEQFNISGSVSGKGSFGPLSIAASMRGEHFSVNQVEEENLYSEETINKTVEKLSSIPSYYEKLVVIMFKYALLFICFNLTYTHSFAFINRNLAINNGFKLTSNSKRLLKEFQLRYCLVNFLFRLEY